MLFIVLNTNYCRNLDYSGGISCESYRTNIIPQRSWLYYPDISFSPFSTSCPRGRIRSYKPLPEHSCRFHFNIRIIFSRGFPPGIVPGGNTSPPFRDATIPNRYNPDTPHLQTPCLSSFLRTDPKPLPLLTCRLQGKEKETHGWVSFLFCLLSFWSSVRV